ncbi:uncharacterized protein LOC121368092 isoform X2 [Gigantopelta aegis]|uniref:uncharacterized protein LOC121368092 isoform X2 n=1 Tax=Gigantopelta aegis TaxID=1735272 RepID=UPI001B88DEA3|nr:uncharacterized protein LOC121368092 isoform X2 [Gigantopelta aegis]
MSAADVTAAPVIPVATATTTYTHNHKHRPGYKLSQSIQSALPNGMVNGEHFIVLRKSSTSKNPDDEEIQEIRKTRSKHNPYKNFENVRLNLNQSGSTFRRNQHEQLVQKIRSQKEVIKVKVKSSPQPKSDGRDRSKQQRDVKKSPKQSKDGALQDSGKQSIEDCRVACQTKKAGATQSKQKTPRQTKSPNSSKMNASQRVKRIGRIRPAATHSPVREQDNEEDDEDREKDVPVDLADLPWHHAQLYRLYGEEADYFIHPKLEPKGNKPFSPKLKASIGHIGAADLWATLRSESMDKLLREDLRFPHELKEAYSAFVRESLSNRKDPVKRSYCATEDVPEMDRLMDRSTLHRIHMARHRQELMYRASKRNHSTMAILMYNNPLPDVNRHDYGISRYYTSLDQDFSELPDLEYKDFVVNKTKELEQKSSFKLVSPRPSSLRSVSKPDEKSSVRLLSPRPSSLISVIKPDEKSSVRLLSPRPSSVVSVSKPDHNLQINPKPERPQLPKIQFLTEETTVEPGHFREKFQQKKPAGLPKEHKPQTSMGFQQNAHDKMERCRSLASVQSMRKCTSDWQPLTMNALMEYKQNVEVEGEGQFNQGKPKLWPVSLKT